MELNVADVRKAAESTKTAIAFMQKHGLLRKLMNCICGAEMTWNARKDLKDGFTWRCSKAECRKKLSIRNGSFFFRSKLPLPLALDLSRLWAAEIHPTRIGTVTQCMISERCAAWHYCFYREACSRFLAAKDGDGILVLGGCGKKVHVSDSVYQLRTKVSFT